MAPKGVETLTWRPSGKTEEGGSLLYYPLYYASSGVLLIGDSLTALYGVYLGGFVRLCGSLGAVSYRAVVLSFHYSASSR